MHTHCHLLQSSIPMTLFIPVHFYHLLLASFIKPQVVEVHCQVNSSTELALLERGICMMPFAFLSFILLFLVSRQWKARL